MKTLESLAALALVTAALASPLLPGAEVPDRAPATIDVRATGATGDGKTLDTAAIQEAIRRAAEGGGGTVVLGPGTYLSGTLVLESRVTLRLEAGATLLGSTDPADFPPFRPDFRSYTETYVCQSLILAHGERDVGIVGSGTIDGQGAAYRGKPYRERPYLLRVASCEGVRVEGIALRDSPMWVQHYLDCTDVVIRGITVVSHVNANNDMIDIDSCRNVRISDCAGDTGDDAITLKSTGARPCEDVVVTNCAVFSTCNAIKLGTESVGGFRDIAISNCVLAPTGLRGGAAGERMLAGIALEIVDGGTLERVTISNIAMRDVRVPIFLCLGNRGRPSLADQPRPGIGTFRDVTISGIVAEALEPIGCSISGLPGHPIRGVSLSHVRMSFPGGGTAEHARREIPERAEAYPECTMFGTLPAWGFWCRHVEGLTLDDVKVSTKEADARPALFLDDVREVEVAGFRPAAIDSTSPVVVLRGVRDALVRGCVAPEGCGTFLRIEGASSGIVALGNDLRRARVPFETAADAKAPPGERILHEEANARPEPGR